MRKVLVLLIVAIMAFGTITAFAAGEPPAVEKSAYFRVMAMSANIAEADVFRMISEDGELVILISEITVVIFEDGTAAQDGLMSGKTLAELLDGRNLAVTYSIATFSLPPQTRPDKIVILGDTVNLFETEKPPIWKINPPVAPPLEGFVFFGLKMINCFIRFL